MVRRKPKPQPVRRLYAWQPDRKASLRAIQWAIIQALHWRERIARLPEWRAKSCSYMIDAAERDAQKSVKRLARERLEYLRLRAFMPGAYAGYPGDRPARDRWNRLNGLNKPVA